MSKSVSVIIPARNEEALIGQTLASVQSALDILPSDIPVEIIVVDNGSTDNTRRMVELSGDGIRLVTCPVMGAARARNLGARSAHGSILVFLDADTRIPVHSIDQIVELCRGGIGAGIAKLAPLDGGFRARCWWLFWNCVRLLPMPRAKAMPAFMFCTMKSFEEFGPFDEDVAIGEEWPILAGLYRRRRREFIYVRSITAYTSSRRMELLSFGYTRLFLKYVWAILDYRGRVHYTDMIRHDPAFFHDGE